MKLPDLLRRTLDRAGFRGLDDLAIAAGYKPQTIRLARIGGRRVSPQMAHRLGELLELPAGLVEGVLRAPRGPSATTEASP